MRHWVSATMETLKIYACSAASLDLKRLEQPARTVDVIAAKLRQHQDTHDAGAIFS